MSNSKRTMRLLRVIDRAIFRTDSSLDYARTVEALFSLACAVDEQEPSDNAWEACEGSCDIGSLIVGAYWHFSAWHMGQGSASYHALCALGDIYDPNCSEGPEPDTCEAMVFEALDAMASGKEGES